jgi:DNA-binding transcriptional regulator YhcF (GntR family)
VAPPSGLRVNRQSSVPVHVQLQTQIRHLISSGALKPGVQLPTVRQLAGFLRINRNTAARALAALHHDGYLESRQGRGTFVSVTPPTREGGAARSLERLVDDTLERARRLGFTHEELMATLAAHTGQLRRPAPGRLKAILVECNAPELQQYSEQLESELPLEVERVLVDEFSRRAPQDADLLRDVRVIVTTFFHIHEVKRALPAGAPPVVALLSEANIKTLLRLTELPEGTVVGLVCTTPRGSQNILSSMQSAGLSHLVPVLASADDPWSIDRMLEKTRLVVCSDLAADRIRTRLPADVEVIRADRRLDSGGMEMLRGLVADLEVAQA